MSLKVAIIGRPNVGKSTLFNRLVGKKLALVDDQPGVTRDRRYGKGRLGHMSFDIIDTAGLEEVFDNSIEGMMRQQSEMAFEECDVALFLIDARAGLTPLDNHFADWLRKRQKPVYVIANKHEGINQDPGLYEAYGLGLGDVAPISAEHGLGIELLYDILEPQRTKMPLVKMTGLTTSIMRTISPMTTVKTFRPLRSSLTKTTKMKTAN